MKNLNTFSTKKDSKQRDTIEAPESDYLYIKLSQIDNAGKGLFTAIDLYKDEIISYFKGERIDKEEAEKRIRANKDRYFINLLDGSIMDSMNTNCYAKYANDAAGLSANNYKNNAKITLDDENNICLQAKKYIKSGEEIFCSYGKAYWKKHK